jgi:hypothetical protein
MTENERQERWLQNATLRLTEHAQAEFLEEILTTRDTDANLLAALIVAQPIPALYRCAALDRYVSLRIDEIRLNHSGALLVELREFIKPLVSLDQENNDELRFTATQWRAQLIEELDLLKEQGTVFADPTVESEFDWTSQAENDPSAHVRWLALLGQSGEGPN